MNPAIRAALEGIAQFRQKLHQGRALSPEPPEGGGVQWDLHERRLDVIEELVRANRPEDEALRAQLTREMIQDFQSEVAAAMSRGGAKSHPHTNEPAEESLEEEDY